MIGEITNLILEGIRSHGMIAVIAGVAIETIIVPLPSPLILMAAGAVLITTESIAQALLAAFWISLIAGIAQTIGSYLVYGIAYIGGKPLIDKFERFHGVSWKEIESFEHKFKKGKREEITLFFLRALPIMPLSVISGVAGAVKMDFKKFTLATFLGVVPRNMILAMLGWQLKETYMVLADHLDNIETLMSMFIVLAILGYIIAHKLGIIDKVRKKIL